MKSLVLLFAVCCATFAQDVPMATPKGEPPISNPADKYSRYSLLLVGPPGAEGVAPMVIERQVRFVPVSSVKQAIDSGAVPVSLGDLQQLMGQLVAENQRLAQENEHLWKIAENKSSPAVPPTVVVQTPTSQAPDLNAQKRAMQMMLLRQMLAPRQSNTLNLNVRDCSKYPALCGN